MPSDALTGRATALVNAVSKERHQNLAATIQQIRETMNARGVFHSSMHLDEVSKACALEMRNIGGLVWEHMKRAHESCGSKISDDLLALFRTLLLAEKNKMEQVQEEAVSNIAGQLQNKTLIPMQRVSEIYNDLLRQYTVEIEIYISNLQRGAGTTLADGIRNGLMNNWPIAAAVIVVATIVSLAAFTDALGKLSGFIKGVFGEG